MKGGDGGGSGEGPSSSTPASKLLYALVSRGSVVLAEQANAPSGAANTARRILERVPAAAGGDSRMSYSQVLA